MPKLAHLSGTRTILVEGKAYIALDLPPRPILEGPLPTDCQVLVAQVSVALEWLVGCHGGSLPGHA